MIHELWEGFIVKNLKLCEWDDEEWIDFEGIMNSKILTVQYKKWILKIPFSRIRHFIIILHQIGKEEYLNNVLRY